MKNNAIIETKHSEDTIEKNDNPQIKQNNSKLNPSMDIVPFSDNNQKEPNKSHKIMITLSITLIILITALLSIVFAIVNQNNNNIMSGVSINNIDISGLSKEQATKTLENLITKKLQQEITLKYGDIDETILLNQITLNYDIQEAVNQAYSIGRTENLFHNNYQIAKSLILKSNIDLNIVIDNEKLEEIIHNLNIKIPNAIVQYSYYKEGSNLIITPGTAGIKIKETSLIRKFTKICTRFRNKSSYHKYWGWT